ncbi:MAG: 3'(2'),5'-bisphosphate nucleotidase CysQ [Rhizobiaceae bacterium]|nr:3'(2'),5'-bisphosphate nucleotidase CysQ [Rhizobiaceae bacterium]
MKFYAEMIAFLEPVAREAGDAIMHVYNAGGGAKTKGDGSPVTEADRQAEVIILGALKSKYPEIPIISEENADSHSLDAPERFFLVDPLDGTKEFLKRDGKGSFTVNIALIENSEPTLGIVYAPALDRMFSGSIETGATENGQSVLVRDIPGNGAVAVASASHRDEATNNWLESHSISQTVSIGSSLKFCLVAAGEADVYPRFGPTMEWDTAAGDAVLRASGGSVENPDGSAFCYGKPEYRNGAFVAKGKF